MNPHDQHVAISQAMGWRIGNPKNSRLDYRWWIPPGKEPRENEMFMDRPPDYLNSLDAMHGPLLSLGDQEAMRYRCILAQMGVDRNFDPMMAEPFQQAEAFLKVKKLWVDSPPP